MTNSTATTIIVLLGFIAAALIVLIMVLMNHNSYVHGDRAASIDAYREIFGLTDDDDDVVYEPTMDDLERFHAMTLATIAAVLNPYNETADTTPGDPSITVTNADTDTEDPDFDYDPTDTLIPITPNAQSTMMVPPGFDPTPTAENDPETLTERNAYQSQVRDDQADLATRGWPE